MLLSSLGCEIKFFLILFSFVNNLIYFCYRCVIDNLDIKTIQIKFFLNIEVESRIINQKN